MKIYDLSVNGVNKSLVLPVEKLRISWKIHDTTFKRQKNYRVSVSCGDEKVFDTGVVESDESAEVCLEKIKLNYESEYLFKVECENEGGEKAEICEKFFTETNDWSGARFIKPKKAIPGWSPYLRKKFIAGDKKIVDAKLWGVGLGVGEFFVNGEKVGDGLCDPPSTNYEKTILYRCWDVTEMVKNGGNCVAIQLGEGFYSQRRVWGGMVYGDECAIAKLSVAYADGSKDVIITDDTWTSKLSPITENSIYGGEVYDARLETPDFALFGGDEDGWGSVVFDETPKGKLTGCLIAPVKVIRELPCREVYCAAGKDDGAWVFDLGENFAGIYEVVLPPSPAGHVYTFRTTETVDTNGQLDHRSTGAMATQVIQQEIYISKGKPGEVYRPKFTYHGFRYLEMTGMHDFSEGYGTMPKKEMVKGLQTATNLRKISSFKCSNEDMNKLHGIMHNTFLSNYHGYPEDCPAREKCGWLGDAEVVSNWALYNYDMTAAYEKYLSDIRTTREVYGKWEMIAPGKRGCGEASPLWGCAQIIIPYWMWKYTGNRAVIEENIDLMRLWIEHELARSEDYVITEGLGDWDPPSTKERKMPVPHSSTLMFYEINIRMAEISEAFGFGDADKYKELAEKIKESFIRHFYGKTEFGYGWWGTNGAALLLGVYPDGEKEKLLNATLSQIEKEDYCMPTGIYGNKYLIPALIENGKGDVALRYMFNRDNKSFGTMMDDGATTVWEDLAMNHVEPSKKKGAASYDHPMHGGCLYFYHAYVVGLEPEKPGYKTFSIRPRAIRGISSAETEYDSPYGKIAFAYETAEGKTKYRLEVPFGTECHFTGFDGVKKTLLSGKYEF